MSGPGGRPSLQGVAAFGAAAQERRPHRDRDGTRGYHFTEGGGMRQPLPVWKPTPTVGSRTPPAEGVALTIQSVGKCVQDLIFGGTFLIESRPIWGYTGARCRIMSGTVWSARPCPAGVT